MIVKEQITIGKKIFRHTYSDSGYVMRKVGTDELYTDAIDLMDADYEYEETDELISTDIMKE